MSYCPTCNRRYESGEVFCPVDGSRIVSDAPADEAHDPLVGSVLQGRYRIIERLGEGGMGVVYVAEHVEIEKRVAVKVLREDFSNRPDVVARFRQEARSASRIGNPHIVDVIDFGELPSGGVFFVMEMLEGQPLDRVCNGRPLPLERAVPIIDQIARALQAAHDKGIVHRDLKPENVFLVNRDDQRDFVKILDFGIAKMTDREGEGHRLTQTGMIFGTPEYMSPEQAAGKKTDHRVDIYALGCMMFEMFTGSVPYTGDSFMAILTQHMFEPIPDIAQRAPDTDVPPSVQSVVYKAMAKEVRDRYASMNALREDLAAALRDANFRVEMSNDASMAFRLEKLARSEARTAAMPAVTRPRGRRAALAGAVAVVALVAVGVWWLVRPVQRGPAKAVTPVTPLPSLEAGAVEGRDTGDGDAASENTSGTEPEKVVVTLGTIPAGAVVSVEGMGQVCSETPCQVALPVGQPLAVEASVGNHKAATMFTPSDQNTELLIEIPLEGGAAAKRRAASTKAKAGRGTRTKRKKGSKASSGGDAGGLKIPDLFKNN